MLDTLPFDVFSQIHDFIGVHIDHGTPLCSRIIRELWLEHAKKEIRRIQVLFVHQVHFEKKDTFSLTSRYLKVVRMYRAYIACASELIELRQNCETGIIWQELGLVRKVGEILSLNPLVDLEPEVLPCCITALQKAFRLRTLAAMILDDGPPVVAVLEVARPVFAVLFRRLVAVLHWFRNDPNGFFKLNNVCDAVFLVRFVLWRSGSLAQREASTRLFFLLTSREGPPHIPTLVIEACRLVQEGMVQESVATYRQAIAGCAYRGQSHYVPALVENLPHLLEFYGKGTTEALAVEAGGHLMGNRSLVEPGLLLWSQLEFSDAIETMLHDLLPLIHAEENDVDKDDTYEDDESIFSRQMAFRLLRSISRRWS